MSMVQLHCVKRLGTLMNNETPDLLSKDWETAKSPYDNIVALIKDKTPNQAAKQHFNGALYAYANTLNVLGQNDELTNVGCSINAHGFTKEVPEKQLEDLSKILTSGISSEKEFYTDPLEISKDSKRAPAGTAGGTAHRDGLFVLISEPNERLKKDGVAAVLVNPAADDIIPSLQKLFPDMPFISYCDVGDYFYDKAYVDEETRDTAMKGAQRMRNGILETETEEQNSNRSSDNGQRDAIQLPPPPEEISIDL